MTKWIQIAVFLGFLALGAVGGAQEKPPVCQFRFLAVGNAPPFDQIIDENGVRVEQEPPAGSIPPRRLLLERIKVGDEREKLGELVLKIGRLSDSIEFPLGGERPLQLREKDDERPWLELPPPVVAGDYLVVLRRERRDGSWQKAAFRVVRDDLPPGGLRFINASSRTLAMIFGTQRIALASGKDWTTRLMPGQVVGLQLGVPDGDGGFRRILSRSLEQGADQRTLVVLSEADRSDARGPGLKITPLTEQVRKQLPTEAPPE